MKTRLRRMSLGVSFCLSLCLLAAGADASPAKPTPIKPKQLVQAVKKSPHTIITPVLTQKLTPGRNVLWSATLQLAWNELMGLAGGPLEMEKEAPLAAALNQSGVTQADLDDASYLALAGLMSSKLLADFEKAQQQKFGERKLSKDLRALPKGSLVAYAYLFKTLPFEWAFTRFPVPLTFAKSKVAAFGVRQYAPGKAAEDKVAQQVRVLDYQSPQDFIIEIATKSPTDRLILAEVTPGASLAATISAVQTRVNQAAPSPLEKMDTVMAPVINFDLNQNYPELCSRKIISDKADLAGKVFRIVRQRTRFTLDERGATVESKAMFVTGIAPRQMIYNAPFLVLLLKRDAKNPYFALWVANAELLTPFRK